MFFSLSTDSTLREIFHEIPCMLQWTCTIKDSGCTSVTLYLDVIFIENLVINFFLLKAVTLLLGIKCNNIRLLAGALIGSLYVVAMILWPERIFFHFSSKFLLSVVMVSVSFKPKSLKIPIHGTRKRFIPSVCPHFMKGISLNSMIPKTILFGMPKSMI